MDNSKESMGSRTGCNGQLNYPGEEIGQMMEYEFS